MLVKVIYNKVCLITVVTVFIGAIFTLILNSIRKGRIICDNRHRLFHLLDKMINDAKNAIQKSEMKTTYYNFRA